MTVLFIGVMLLLIALLTDLDDVFLGLPLLPASGTGMVIYGIVSFSSLAPAMVLASSIISALIVLYVYYTAKKTTSKNLNKR